MSNTQHQRSTSVIDPALQPPKCSLHKKFPLLYVCIDERCPKDKQAQPLCSLCE